MAYNWQQQDWTLFTYNAPEFEAMALNLREMAGHSMGILKGLNDAEQSDSLITLLVKEAIKTSAIEGEVINKIDLVSSIKKNLGYPTPSILIKDKRSEGIAELLVKSRANFDTDLDEQTLFDWHICLMRGNFGVEIGKWRSHTEPMQIVSGAMGKEKIHFEAPPSVNVSDEMKRFIFWFNESKPTGKTPILNPLIRAAIAHLYFESIHPFEDGNGRIGRVIAEKSLAQSLGRPILMSLSAIIEADKNSYYQALQKAQQSNEVNAWIQYFADIILQSQVAFIQTIAYSLKKSHFFNQQKHKLNDRQLKVIERMLAENEDDFTGGMNTRKYLVIAKTSKATATRDLQDLVEKQILIAKGGGRSTNYQVNFEI